MKIKSTQKKKTTKSEKPALHLEIETSGAKQVFLAGSFNDWKIDSIPLKKADDSHWEVDLDLPSGTYEYRFVVDGEWISDPKSKDYVPNVFGSFNSVLHVS
jgi:1,4-alpha-glucan branching enzyme